MNKKFKYKKLFLVVILSVILLVGCDGGGFGFFFDMLFVDFGIGFLLEVKFDLILNLELMFELMLDLEFMLELIFDLELELELEFVFMKMGYLILGGSQWVIGVICNGEISDGFIFIFGEDVICVVGNMIIVIFNIQLEVVCSLCVVEKVLFSFEDV